MEIRTHLASESESPFSEGMMVSLPVTYGSMTYGPTTYEQPPLSSEQETTELNCYQRRARLKTRSAQVTTSVSQQNPVQQNIQVQNDVQPVPASQVQPQVQVRSDPDPVVPNLGPSMFGRSQKRMTLGSNRTANNAPEPPKSSTSTESPEKAKLRRVIDDALWRSTLLTYYRYQSVKFKLSPIQLQELEKIDEEISNIRDSTGRYDCRLLMNKFLLLESYNIPDIGGVYDDEVISKNFPMDLLRMIHIAKGRNIDNLSKTQMINGLNSYNRTVLAFTMVPSKIWGPDL